MKTHLRLLSVLPIALTLLVFALTPRFTFATLDRPESSRQHVANLPRTISTWARTYGGSGNEINASVAETNDGGYIDAGVTNSFGVSGRAGSLIKVDASGNVSWQRTLASGGIDG